MTTPDRIEKAARVIGDALNGPADKSLFGSYTEVDYLPECTLDGKYDLITVTRALDQAGLLADHQRLRAFARDCVTHGDMTPAAQRMLDRILEDT